MSAKRKNPRRCHCGAMLHLGGVAVALLAAAALPPARGTMLILPILPGERTADVVGDDLPIVAAGPAGTLVVYGTRAQAFELLCRGFVAIAVPAAMCGRPA